jgi:integrase/recombinase XerD
MDTRTEAEHYLAARRALGFTLANEACLLFGFVDYLEAHGANRVTIELAVAWATQPQDTDPSYWGQRLSVVRVFARHLQSLDPTVEVPPAGLLPGRGRYRPDPYLYSEADIAALLVAGNALSPRLRAATCATIIGLLAVTGMRIGEAIALDRDDVDLDHAQVRVRNAKYAKARQLPVHASTVRALRSYTVVRDSACPRATANFFCTTEGNRPAYWNIYPDFRQVLRDSGLESRGHRRRPRLHDLRH